MALPFNPSDVFNGINAVRILTGSKPKPENSSRVQDYDRLISRLDDLKNSMMEQPPKRSEVVLEPSPVEEVSELPTTGETLEELKRRLGKELYRMELDLAGGGRIAGKPCDCQPGDSLVYVSGDKHSVLTLQQMAKRKTRRIISHKGKQLITAHLSRPYSGELASIHFDYLNQPLQATFEHPMLIAKEGWHWNWRTHGGICEDKVNWVKAGDVSTDDFIAFPRFSNVQDMDIISPELAEILGWYLSEGCKCEERITISLGHHEKQHIEHVSKLFYKVFGKYPKRYSSKTALALAYANSEFTAIFDAFGHDAPNKRLPEWAIYLPPNKQGYLLRGLFLGDGCFSQNHISYATVSEQLAYQIHFILFRLGIIHGLAKRNMSDGCIDGRIIKSNYPAYFITINGDAVVRLCDIASLPWIHKGQRQARNRGWVGESAIFLPVREVNRIPFTGQVYNVSVSEDESYLTPHGAVHNCLSAKHHFGIEATAEELMAYERNPIYNQIVSWLQDHSAEFEPTNIVKHPAEFYQNLIPEVRAFRKAVMGTETLRALLNPSVVAEVERQAERVRQGEITQEEGISQLEEWQTKAEVGERRFIGVTKETEVTQARSAPWRVAYEYKGKESARFFSNRTEAAAWAKERLGIDLDPKTLEPIISASPNAEAAAPEVTKTVLQMGKEEFSKYRNSVIQEACKTHNKTDVNNFIKAADKQFSSSDIVEYRPKLQVVVREGNGNVLYEFVTDRKEFVEIQRTELAKEVTASPLANYPDLATSALKPSEVIKTNPSILEGNLNSLAGNTKAISDFSKSETFSKQGFGGFDVPTQRLMFNRMLASLHQSEIRNAIIKTIPVDVVDKLIGIQLPANMVLHDPSVNKELLSILLDGSISLRTDTANTLIRRIASLTTKEQGRTAGAVGDTIKGLSAIRTTDIWHNFSIAQSGLKGKPEVLKDYPDLAKSTRTMSGIPSTK